jgi:DnaK suppressor protein
VRPVVEGRAGIMLTASTSVVGNAGRLFELKTSLENRRRELIQEVHGKIRDGRSDYITERDVLDPAESSEVNIQDDIEFALIQLKAETLNKIDMALQRIAEGNYGKCVECGDEIAEARLRALPFALRCKDCEQARETPERSKRTMALRRDSSLRFLDDAGF